MTEVVVTTGTIRLAKLQFVATNKRTSSYLKGRMPFLSPDQRCRSTDNEKHPVEAVKRKKGGMVTNYCPISGLFPKARSTKSVSCREREGGVRDVVFLSVYGAARA